MLKKYPKNKTWTAKVKEKSRKWLSFLLVVFLIAFLFTFTKVAEVVAPLFGTTAGEVRSVSQRIMGLSLAVALIVIASATTLIPVVGQLFWIAAGILIIIESVSWYNDSGIGGGTIDLGR